ncbi:S41 family peptidase [Mucilaginibacter sabulilitoris]|uniref:S41 family peptidase n=1 Tax=Mucilaginibacter sabulilitoris TaxID=1173583 RepID=A0ABZ0TT69_9SPHI|nr:S41 family peptidase [Mucilaginibacter sabulilitoris]WPU96196.1 S41 family peptidase [Mucilaginibacter sabulilitoris]
MRKLFYFILIISTGGIFACKKDKVDGNNNPPPPTNPSDTASAKFELTQDSIYLYAKEIYYWNNSLPDYRAFNPRQYTLGSTDLDKFTSEIDAYTQLSKNPANHNLPYEYDFFNPGSSKYSFIDDGEVDGELNATRGDFGFNYFYNSYTDLRVSLVYPNSPAATAGLKRGDEIIAINNNDNIYITSNFDDPANDPGYKFVSNALNQGSTVTLQIRNSAGTKTVNLDSKTYTVNPIIYTNTYTLSNSRVAGYMVFNSFISNIHSQLDAVFSNFAAKHVTDLIIDLRYNGGGDVETSSYLSNLIAPSSANGSVMNTTYWTANLQNDNYPLLKKKISKPAGWFKSTNSAQIERFAKAGAVNVTRVFFLVTGNTASASELTINNLKPKMDVQLIGDTTYGKPVGFLSKLIINGHYLYTPEFETKNSAQEGGYYAGMPPKGTTTTGGTYNGKQIYEDIVTDFGDKNETLLHQAIKYIETNAYPASSNLTIQSLSTTRGRPMTLYQRRVLSSKVQPNRTNSMFINLK